ncbi:hypothetical protein HMPREF3038_01519 [Akkermansia sp. KLE1797]|nr:hypothetical protein HMPREF3038_01519 [Akkermansia sp. KLE1797]KXU54007.1 hypothetical protein HMPREF3039_01672 [Akkermansia sp. KLE1798]KZA05491.1 hypothetical protein HMPREF1326_00666 [Akkermansia sp. KLE1605]
MVIVSSIDGLSFSNEFRLSSKAIFHVNARKRFFKTWRLPNQRVRLSIMKLDFIFLKSLKCRFYIILPY